MTKPDPVSKRLHRFRQLSPKLPFEEVVSWVWEAPLPTQPRRRWWQWWRS